MIELLIVIAIIGILATIIMVAYGNVQAKSRDAKRVADVNALAGAAKMYQVDHKKYPKRNATECFARVRTERDGLDLLLGPYITIPLPVDPKDAITAHTHPIWQDSGDYYYYTYLATEASFVFAARTELQTNDNTALLGGKTNIKPPSGIRIGACTAPSVFNRNLSQESFAPASRATGHYFYIIGENLYP